jgi:hypothetical protein
MIIIIVTAVETSNLTIKILFIDLNVTEASDDCTDEDHPQFNIPATQSVLSCTVSNRYLAMSSEETEDFM